MVSTYTDSLKLEMSEAVERREKLEGEARYCAHNRHNEPVKLAADNTSPFCSACYASGFADGQARTGTVYMPRLNEFREQLGWTWKRMSEETGTSASTLKGVAYSNRACSQARAESIASAMDIDLRLLVGGGA